MAIDCCSENDRWPHRPKNLRFTALQHTHSIAAGVMRFSNVQNRESAVKKIIEIR